MSQNPEALPQVGSAIALGRDYIYTSGVPAGCAGHRYRPVQFVEDVPSYQQRVLVKCLSGPDRGKWFVCSPANFAIRYQKAPEPDARDQAAQG
jgi:hypothetical protein